MSAERYFNPQIFQSGKLIVLEDQEFHHLVHVMRGQVGDRIELVNGLGQLATCSITKLEKKRAVITLENVFTSPPQMEELILAQAIPKTNRLEFILEKGTELGMTEIWLFPSTRSERRNFSESHIDRFQGILVAALKQCDRLFLPKLILKTQIKDWEKPSIPSYFGDVSPFAQMFADVLKIQQPTIRACLFCVGPESGFTVDETVMLKELGFDGVKLHKNILRTDTAGIAALSVISQFL